MNKISINASLLMVIFQTLHETTAIADENGKVFTYPKEARADTARIIARLLDKISVEVNVE